MATTETQDARMARLPKWAQDRITLLERNLASERAKLAVGPAESNTIADPYADTPRQLGMATTIEFVLAWYEDGGSREYVQARLEDGELIVRGSDSIGVFPSASNTVRVRLVRP